MYIAWTGVCFTNNYAFMREQVYESPQCSVLRIELHSHILNASNESYSVNRFNDPFGEEEDE